MSWIALPPDNASCTDPWHMDGDHEAPFESFTYRVAYADGRLSDMAATGARCLGCGAEGIRMEAVELVPTTCQDCGKTFEGMPPPDTEATCTPCFESRLDGLFAAWKASGIADFNEFCEQLPA